MKYYRTYWLQDKPDFPTWIFSEVGIDRLDTRRLEIFNNGSAKYFDSRTPFVIGVSQYPENLDELNDGGELFIKEITLEEFEEALSHYDLNSILS
ncbi:hypothetical protein RFL03_10280 [Streptococcus parasuis]|uniref:DUF6881 domain-containing protein n=1 Tax=Streptococcus parasuis TaxID=1501662 RepID=UPI002FC6B53D